MAVGDVVPVLNGDDRSHVASLGQLPRVHVREADVADLPLLVEPGERADGFLDRHRRIYGMELVEVDSLDTQAAQAGLAGGAGGLRSPGAPPFPLPLRRGAAPGR